MTCYLLRTTYDLRLRLSYYLRFTHGLRLTTYYLLPTTYDSLYQADALLRRYQVTGALSPQARERLFVEHRATVGRRAVPGPG